MRCAWNDNFHTMGFDATVSAIIISALFIIGILLGVLTYLRSGVQRIPAFIVGIVALAICLMANVIDNDVSYAGWALAIFGVGCIIGGIGLSKNKGQ